MTAWQGTPLRAGRPFGRRTEPDPECGIEPTRVCAAFLLPGVPGALQRVLLREGQEQPSEPGQWGALRRPLAHRAGRVWDMWLLSCTKGDAPPVPRLPPGHRMCLRPHRKVCTCGPWESPPAPSCRTGALRGCGEAVGTASQWGQRMRVCIPCCTPLLIVREGKAFPQRGTRVTLYACQPALWRGLGFCWILPILLVFAYFAGCEQTMLSSRGSCGSPGAVALGRGGGRRGGQREACDRSPVEKGTFLGFVVHYQLTL